MATDREATFSFAYYLPQFHPTPLNDEWWGEGFTEWNSLLAMHRGVRTPRSSQLTPGELGFYDLLSQDTRDKQAELAKLAGVSAFGIYHYYSQGNRPMPLVVDSMLADGSPDHPFFFCWANHDWTLAWKGEPDSVTWKQQYDDPSDDRHIDYLLAAFADPRYVAIDNHPVLMIYAPAAIPNVKQQLTRWRERARLAGYDGLFIIGNNSSYSLGAPQELGLDAWIQTQGMVIKRLGFRRTIFHSLTSPMRAARFLRFRDRAIRSSDYLAASLSDHEHQPRDTVPLVLVGWNNTGRRKFQAWYLRDNTVQHYSQRLEAAKAIAPNIGPTERSKRPWIALNAWNEWGEGMALEPSVEFSRSFLEATRQSLGSEGGYQVPR